MVCVCVCDAARILWGQPYKVKWLKYEQEDEDSLLIKLTFLFLSSNISPITINLVIIWLIMIKYLLSRQQITLHWCLCIFTSNVKRSQCQLKALHWSECMFGILCFQGMHTPIYNQIPKHTHTSTLYSLLTSICTHSSDFYLPVGCYLSNFPVRKGW